MSSASDFSRASTIFSMRCLPSAPKVALDVFLPQRFAEFAIGEVDAALPARLNLFLAAEVLLELEIGFDEGLGKPRRGVRAAHASSHKS